MDCDSEVHVEIARLVLRRPKLADVPALFEFPGDAQAVRYTHHDATLRACRRRVAVHERRRRRDGYAPWTIITKADGRIMGPRCDRLERAGRPGFSF